MGLYFVSASTKNLLLLLHKVIPPIFFYVLRFMSSDLASVLESNLNLMKICAVYSLKILLGNLTWWMVSFSAPKLQVWKLALKCVYDELGFLVCERGRCRLFCCGFFFFPQKHCKRGERTLKKKLGILGDNFSFLFLRLEKTNLAIQVLFQSVGKFCSSCSGW